MKITARLTDESLMQELGGRLAGARIGRDLTQAALAEQAGVSKRTVERLESGQVATQLSSFLRVCRVLGLVEQFEALIPAPATSPMAQLKQQGRKRQRASAKKASTDTSTTEPKTQSKKWTWGETP